MTPKTPAGTRHGSRGPARSAQRLAAEAAGLSRHQRRQALALADIPEDVFEALIESDNPPTIAALTGRGGRQRGSVARRCPHCGGDLS